MKYVFSLVALLLGSLTVTWGQAQVAAGKPLPQVLDSIIQLKEVLVVAERVPTRSALVSLSSALADRFGPSRDLTADLGTLAGIQSRSYGQPGGQSSLSIWGASSQQGLVLLDGHPIANPISGTPDLGLIPAVELAGAEVVRGASSSLYGSSALGGVVNLLSESPTNHLPGRWYGNAVVDAGTFRNADAGFCLGRRFANWGGQAFASGRDANGPRSNDGISGWNGGLGFGLYPAHDLRFVVDASVAKRDLGLPGPAPDTRAIPNFGDSSASSRYDRESDRQTEVRADISWSPTDALSLEFKPDWRHLNTRYRTLSPWAPGADSVKLDDYTSSSLGGALLANYEYKGNRLVVGYDNSFDFADVLSQSDTNWSARSGNNAVWAELKVPVRELVYLGGSVRADFNPGFKQAFSPSLGVAVPVRDWLKFRANWGTAFRAPSISDRYWPKSGVPNLKPEHGSTLQGGFDVHSRWLNVEATAFLRRTSDLISWQPDTGGLWRPANIDSSRHLGAELMLDALPVSGLDIRACATWLNAQQVRNEVVYSNWTTGETRSEFVRRQAAFLPKLNLNAQASYRFRFGTRVMLSGRFESERLNYYPNYDSAPEVRMDTKRLPALAVFGCEVSQTFLRRWQAVLKVDNVLNRAYSEQFGNSIGDLNYPMPGRTVAIQLRYAIE